VEAKSLCGTSTRRRHCVFAPKAYIGQTHVTPLERAALAEL
jgi:hypothetical protein